MILRRQQGGNSTFRTFPTDNASKIFILKLIVDFDCMPLKQVHLCYHLTEDIIGIKQIIQVLLARGMTVEDVASIAGMDISGVTEILNGTLGHAENVKI